ncbi:phosphoribosylamine--glycine ligase [Clostridiaceae bacterium DONG20-135]|uniref:Phosphoribosylamine--glycine ligase n=1 Tax=Copranaerobaculum intestinale TaxID=2692629 RepID=A0A6N8U4B6_9FIRM|nr:phosphoribosylamine--glycine ligase [Copranaerobaculum intestinale]MXQ72731.1 phosphoribosylamine--glycine ligase [Copranaerobaculum intestinale]
MKVLVIGKGGREHAIAHAAYRSPQVDQVYAAPGNVGMENIARCVAISDSDIAGLVAFAKKEAIDLTIVGPESSLSLGVVDAFTEAGLLAFGPTKDAAQVESSKDFAKKIMMKYQIPTAAYQTFRDYDCAYAYVMAQGAPIVIKEDGLKAGKGVTVAKTIEEAEEALKIAFEIPNNQVVIEECLVGFEFSLICFVNGTTVIPMEIAQDHKCAYDGDTGPNTGGMGVYSPVKRITPAIIEDTMNQVMRPMAEAMVEEGHSFTGFLYGGLMLTDDGVKTIEFNARFGDPEAEVILPRLKTDFISIIQAVMNHQEITLEWDDQVTLGVVMASTNYPASSTKGALIEGVENVDSMVYYMGAKRHNAQLVTDGGRVLIVVAKADTLAAAYEKAYEDVHKIHCKHLFYRNDIGKKDME